MMARPWYVLVTGGRYDSFFASSILILMLQLDLGEASVEVSGSGDVSLTLGITTIHLTFPSPPFF